MLSNKWVFIAASLLTGTLGCSAACQAEEQPAQTAPSSSGQGWISSFGSSVREWTNKVPRLTDEAQKYSEQLKNEWPAVREELKKQWNSGVEKGKAVGADAEDWLNKTFQKEHIQKAEQWLRDFKQGTEEKVIDPLVPYLLSVRYASPLDEWNAGYRRQFPVQIQKNKAPVLITLPVSWELADKVGLPEGKILSWKNEAGNGNLSISLITTPYGSTPESLMAGLERKAPGNRAQVLPGTEIQRILIPASGSSSEAGYYYAVPTPEDVVLLCGQAAGGSAETAGEINEKLKALTPFFDTVTRNIFIQTAN
jgi:hypothetical protein